MLVEQSVVCPVLVGRGAPLFTVAAALDRARAGRGGTLLISGDAGIGKSRLVRAMAERAHELRFVVLQGACFEADRSRPYAPILDLVHALSTTTSPAVAAHSFEIAGGELVTFFPELRSIFPDAPVRSVLDPEEDRRRLFHSFTAAVNALGRRQPLLVVIEDVHWSDDATLDLILHLAQRIGASAITLALTFRSDELGPRLSRLLADLDHARCASEIGLRPFAAVEVAAMLQAIFGSQAFGAPFVNRLCDLTEGNPFFVEEMLKSLLVAGDLECTDGIWRARPLEYVHVPRTASEAVGRRLSGLGQAARDVASVAAVAGRRFDFAILQALTGYDERTLLSLIKELVEAQLVVEESADRFAFRHALTRETIRARLLLRERVALHRAIALALEQTSRGHAREVDDALAYHTFEAGMWEPARRYALRAAEHALTLCAPREALHQFDRALTATRNAGMQPEPPLLIARGRAHETLGAFTQANEDFNTALGAARAAGDHRAVWSALHALGMLWAARDYMRAGQYRHEALELARTIGDPLLIAHSLNRVGNWYVNREAPQAGIPHHDEALAIFERAHDTRGVAETVDLLAMAHHVAGSQDAAVPLCERSIDLFTALEDRRGLANALTVLASCGPSYHACAGTAVTSFHTPDLLANERPVRLSTEIGWRAGEAFSRWVLADAVAWCGDFGRALGLARESLAIARELEHLEWQCGARRVLGTIALDLCALTEALTHLESAHELAKRLASAIWIRWTAAPLAIALLRAGDAMRATTILEDVQRILSESVVTPPKVVRRTLGERYLALARSEIALAEANPAGALAAIDPRDAVGTPRVALLQGQAMAAQERWTEATAALDAARVEAERQHARPLLWRIDAAQGAIHLKRRRRLEARQCFDAARSLAAELVSSLGDAELAAAFRAAVDELAPPPADRTASQAAKDTYGGLTRRERDTAALVAQGKSNRAIARTLGIGERTVEGYVAAALSKLGFSSRAQIAVWATEHGLVKSEPASGRSRR